MRAKARALTEYFTLSTSAAAYPLPLHALLRQSSSSILVQISSAGPRFYSPGSPGLCPASQFTCVSPPSTCRPPFRFYHASFFSRSIACRQIPCCCVLSSLFLVLSSSVLPRSSLTRLAGQQCGSIDFAIQSPYISSTSRPTRRLPVCFASDLNQDCSWSCGACFTRWHCPPRKDLRIFS